MGRYAKAPGQTRHPERHHWRELPAGSAMADSPPLPERHDGGEWTTEAVEAWAAWWGSPMAAAWLPSDAVAVRRALHLVDEAARGKRGRDGALVAVLDRLGLTPAGRLRLQWLVPTTPAAPAPVIALAPRPPSDPREPA